MTTDNDTTVAFPTLHLPKHQRPDHGREIRRWTRTDLIRVRPAAATFLDPPEPSRGHDIGTTAVTALAVLLAVVGLILGVLSFGGAM